MTAGERDDDELALEPDANAGCQSVSRSTTTAGAAAAVPTALGTTGGAKSGLGRVWGIPTRWPTVGPTGEPCETPSTTTGSAAVPAASATSGSTAPGSCSSASGITAPGSCASAAAAVEPDPRKTKHGIGDAEQPRAESNAPDSERDVGARAASADSTCPPSSPDPVAAARNTATSDRDAGSGESAADGPGVSPPDTPAAAAASAPWAGAIPASAAIASSRKGRSRSIFACSSADGGAPRTCEPTHPGCATTAAGVPEANATEMSRATAERADAAAAEVEEAVSVAARAATEG